MFALLLVCRIVEEAKYYYAPLLRNLDAGVRAFVQKVLEKETVEFYKRDRAGTGGLAKNEQVSSSCVDYQFWYGVVSCATESLAACAVLYCNSSTRCVAPASVVCELLPLQPLFLSRLECMMPSLVLTVTLPVLHAAAAAAVVRDSCLNVI
jgi:hypothetical protein